ncbi:MAG: hypothetical protein C0614_11450, partial [Desulfuromonas sp.]
SSDFGINNITIYGNEFNAGVDQAITYNFSATDSDLDPASGSFDVTFDSADPPATLSSTADPESLANLLVDEGESFSFSANSSDASISDFNVQTDTLRLADVLDGNGDDMLDSTDISVAVRGADVTLSMTGMNGETTLTLEGINADHSFKGADSLDDLIVGGLQVDFNPDTYAS